jgi:hypothetical protein
MHRVGAKLILKPMLAGLKGAAFAKHADGLRVEG